MEDHSMTKELKALSILSGRPHIVPLLGLSIDECFTLLVLPHYPKCLLTYLSDIRLLPPSQYTWALFLQWAAQLAQALRQIHSCRLIHLDVKPGNVLLSSLDLVAQTSDIQVIDFGSSRELPFTLNPDRDFLRPGTANYMAPGSYYAALYGAHHPI